jgi:hypothetical protein
MVDTITGYSYFYCQPDGGQWNVRVKVIRKHGHICLVCGAELEGTAQATETNWLAVHSDTLFSTEQT